MTILIIVESPAKCKKIESFLGNKYKCIASGGHILKINNLADIDRSQGYNINYSLIDEKKKFYDRLKKEIKSCKNIKIATDDDREGELIGYLICKLFKLDIKKTDRLIFHEITKSAIVNAVNNPVKLNMNIVNSAKTRQIIDMLVGFKVTPILWKHINKSNISAGRCQMPALRIVYDNFKEKQKEKIKFNYSVVGYFTDKNIQCKLNKLFKDESSVKQFLEKSVNFCYKLIRIDSQSIIKPPPLPLNTSRLQQMASNMFNISPNDTMKVCQKLYEKGLITYMRTTSKQLSSKFQTNVEEYISETYSDSLFNSISYPEEQHAHEAIRPTNIKKTVLDESFSLLEKKLYKFIWKISLQSLMKPAKLLKHTIIISAPDKLEYHTIFEEPIELNWMIVDKKVIKLDDYNYLKHLGVNKEVSYKKIITDITVRDQKQYYTEAKLVNILEDYGIGRPSTFSSIIEKLKTRQYVEKTTIKPKEEEFQRYVLEKDVIKGDKIMIKYGGENNKLVIQNKGIIVLEFLLKSHDHLFNYEYTKSMEENLDKIVLKTQTLEKICEDCYSDIEACNKRVEKKEYKIDDNHIYMVGKYGPVIKCIEGDKTIFKKVKKNIDLEKIKDGTYKLEDIVYETAQNKRLICRFKNEDLYICNGPYGIYAMWGDNKKSIPFVKTIGDNLDQKELLAYLETNKFYIKLNDNLSVREGKYGKYVYFKTKKMKKPKFYKYTLTEEDDNKKILEWIKETYNIY